MHCVCALTSILFLIYSFTQDNKCKDVVDLVHFDGASNVQKAGHIVEKRHPRTTSACASEHTTSLFFDNVFKKIDDYKGLCNFSKKLRNVFGSTRHGPASMFKKCSEKHDRGVAIGFIKPSDCR